MIFQEPETLLRGLLKGEHSSLTIGFNELNACNYMTVAEWDDQIENPKYEWISDEERAKARETNSAWSLQWYPETPVGFHCIAASSLIALIEHIAKEGQAG